MRRSNWLVLKGTEGCAGDKVLTKGAVFLFQGFFRGILQRLQQSLVQQVPLCKSKSGKKKQN
jgi:hypothetical protein